MPKRYGAGGRNVARPFGPGERWVPFSLRCHFHVRGETPHPPPMPSTSPLGEVYFYMGAGREGYGKSSRPSATATFRRASSVVAS